MDFMLKALGAFFLFLLINYCTADAQSAPPRDDRQFWSEIQFIKPLVKDIDLVAIATLRIGREWQRPVDERVGAGVAFKVNRYLTIMPTYLYVDQQPYAGLRISEHRTVLNATGRFKVGELTITDRNLIERRLRHAGPDFLIYRNRLQLDHPARLGAFKFKPFLADEVWYSTQPLPTGRPGWFRNRISAGIIKQLNERVNAEFFYLYQHDGVFRPGNVHAVGTLFRVLL
jgi:uncharacterized protein DUF2490